MTEAADQVAVGARRAPLGLGTRIGLRAKHTVRLGREVVRHSADHRMWWLIPVFVLMILVAAMVSTTTTALPVAVYTLF